MRPNKANKSLGILVLITTLCLFPLLLSSLAAASEEELSRVRNEIWSRGAQWTAEENAVSRLPHELRAKRVGLINFATKAPVETQRSGEEKTAKSVQTLPPTLDYRNYQGLNYVTSIKDQGNCGSCWAFSTTATLESRILYDTQGTQITDEAEQILLSCSGAGSCNGGDPGAASQFILKTGLPPEYMFPYTATNSSCSKAQANWQSHTYNITGWQYIWASSVDDLKNALVAYGPLVTTMNVYDDFYYYTGGIYTCTSKKLEGGHAIELIGYDDVNQCFIAKNSWGTGWGEAGFFQIAYTEFSDQVQFGDYAIAYTGSEHVVSQCSYTLSATAASALASGGTWRVLVSSQTGCNWTASSNASWITIKTVSNGSSNGTVNFSVAPNKTGKTRVGTLTIAGQSYTVHQSAK